MSRPGLHISALHAGYGGARVLFGVDLDVEPGAVCLVTGPNGAGKSTLVQAVVGGATVSSGSIELDGRDLGGAGRQERFRLGVGWVPEGRALFGELTVWENLRVVARAWGLSGAETEQRIEEVAARFPIVADKLREPAMTLSGGQQQLVAVARAMLTRPTLLLLDEPSTGLSPAAWKEVLAVCRGAADQGTAVVLIEQRLLDTMASADQIVVIVNGRVARAAAADDPLVTEEALRADYFSREGGR